MRLIDVQVCNDRRIIVFLLVHFAILFSVIERYYALKGKAAFTFL